MGRSEIAGSTYVSVLALAMPEPAPADGELVGPERGAEQPEDGGDEEPGAVRRVGRERADLAPAREEEVEDAEEDRPRRAEDQEIQTNSSGEHIHVSRPGRRYMRAY